MILIKKRIKPLIKIAGLIGIPSFPKYQVSVLIKLEDNVPKPDNSVYLDWENVPEDINNYKVHPLKGIYHFGPLGIIEEKKLNAELKKLGL